MKRKKGGFRAVILGTLGLVLLGAGIQYKRDNGLVLGDRSNNDNPWGFGSNNGFNNNPSQSPTPSVSISIEPTEVVTPHPTVLVTPTIEVTVEPTLEPTVEPTVVISPTVTPLISEEPKKETDQNQDVTNSGPVVNVPVIYKDLVIVPVSQKSVVEGSVYVPEAPKPKSIIKTIQQKFEQVGGGQFLTQPKTNNQPKPTPTLQLNKTKEEADNLTGDVSIFYKFQNGNVVLGAESGSGNSLRIPEGDLRRAEISMGTALQKEGLSLSVSGEDKFVLKDKSYLVLSSMPVLVNIDDRKIYLETGSGKQELSTLPDEAVDTAIEFKAFDKLSNEKPPVLGVVNGELGYDVLGEKTYKLFGKVPVKAKVHVYVMVGSNEVVEGDQSFLTRLIKIASL